MSSKLNESIERIRSYVAAVDTLYDEKEPMPKDLTIDTALNYDDPLRSVARDLLYSDLQRVVKDPVFTEDAMKRAFCAGAWLAGGVSNNDTVDKAFARFMRQEAERAAQG